MDIIKKWLIVFALALITTGSVWIANIDSKTFDSPEQKVTVIKAVETMPTEAEKAVGVANAAHAIEIRQLRYIDAKKNDSLDRVYEHRKDSLVLDQIKRQTVQIEQMKSKLDNIQN
jgi:ribosomal protein L24